MSYWGLLHVKGFAFRLDLVFWTIQHLRGCIRSLQNRYSSFSKRANDVTLRFTVLDIYYHVSRAVYISWSDTFFCNSLTLQNTLVLVYRSRILSLVHIYDLLSMLLYRNWADIKTFLFWFTLNTFSWHIL